MGLAGEEREVGAKYYGVCRRGEREGQSILGLAGEEREVAGV